MLQFLQRILLLLPPEIAHQAAKVGLKILQSLRFKICKRTFDSKVSLHLTGLPSLRFPNRVGLGAGFDKDAEMFAALSLLGFGFIEVGTVTPEPQQGNPRPRLWRTGENTLVNHMGFNSAGIISFRENILRYRRLLSSFPLFANLGKNRVTPNELAIEDYVKSAVYLADCVDGFVINLSSPNTPGLTHLQNKGFLESIAARLPATVPLWVKLSPDLDNVSLEELCDEVQRNARISGIVVTNTSRRLAESHGHGQGGMSGAPLFERSLECVSIARQLLKEPKLVIGVGGITTLERARKMRREGADLIEVYTGFVYQGPRFIRELGRELA